MRGGEDQIELGLLDDEELNSRYHSDGIEHVYPQGKAIRVSVGGDAWKEGGSKEEEQIQFSSCS